MKKVLVSCIIFAMIFSLMPIMPSTESASAASKVSNPSYIYGTAVGKTSVKIKWAKVSGAKQYVVYRNGVKKATVKSNYYIAKNLKGNKAYSFKVRAKGGNGYGPYSYSVKVTGKKTTAKGYQNVKTIKLNRSSVALLQGKTTTLKATLIPSKKIVSKKVTWTSSDKTIATVNSKGVVTAKKKGTCYIYARSHNGLRAKCKVEVAVANTIIKNGRVYQVEGNAKNATAVVIEGKNIVYVGSDTGANAYKTSKSKVIDAKGGTIMPSLTDSHMHVSSAGSYMYEIPLYNVGTKEEMLEIITDFIAETPSLDVYAGGGWMVSAFGSKGPNKADLDAICSDKPIILTSADGHSTWVNSKALELAGITKDTANPNGGEIVTDESGEPTGYLKEAAGGLVSDLSPEYTKEQMKEAILWEQEWFASLGFTSMFDAGMYLEEETYYMAIEELAEEGKLTLRIRGSWWIQPYDFDTWEECKEYIDKCNETAKKFKTEYYRVNTVKIMVDQVLEEATAYMKDGYYKDYEDHSKGKEVTEQGKIWAGKEDMLKKVFQYADDEGMQIHIHQIGDAAADYALDLLEEVQSTTNPNLKDHRVSFVHCQFIDEEDQNRMAALGINAIVAPYWAVMDDYYWDVYEPMVGIETLNKQYPMKSLMKKGINVSIHSDFFVTEPDMGWLFYSAMTRTLPQKIFDLWYGAYTEDYIRITDPTASQDSADYGGKMPIAPLKNYAEKLSLKEIIKASTYNGAYSIYLEDQIGSLEVGKKADILVMQDNLFELDTEDIANIQPELTIFDGKTVYDASQTE